MPTYIYRARDFQGNEIEGEMEAENEFALAKILKEKGYFLIGAKPKEKKKILTSSVSVPLTERIFFTRNLKTMVAAGVSLPRAIEILSLQTRHKKFKKILGEIKERITKGEAFSDTLNSYPKAFPEIYRNVIKVGEETGKLEEVLEKLASQMEVEHELKSQIKGAMYYPAVVILAMVGVGILMLTFVVPKLSETFKELNVSLPPTTRFVIFLGDTLSQKGGLIFLILIFFVFLVRYFLKTKAGKKLFHKLLLKIPTISKLVSGSNIADTCRNLSLLISAGVSLPRALEICSKTLGNVWFQEDLGGAVDFVSKGGKLSEYLQKSKVYPLSISQMILVGEESGQMSEVLERLSHFYETETLRLAKNLTSIVEPVLLLVLGGAVGFFAISMLQPIYSILSAIK